ncbi:MAG: DUF3035 domain-containing protein [Alphaproteobacteria bacterium]
MTRRTFYSTGFIAQSFALIAIALVLQGCSNAKDRMGLTRTAPDEFKVVTRAPLSMPPEYRLAPPQPGAPRPQEMDSVSAARQSLFGENATAAAAVEPVESEQLLLEQAGALNTPANIRTIVDQEALEAQENQRSVTRRLIGIGRDGTENDVINPNIEAARLGTIAPAPNAANVSEHDDDGDDQDSEAAAPPQQKAPLNRVPAP